MRRTQRQGRVLAESGLLNLFFYSLPWGMRRFIYSVVRPRNAARLRYMRRLPESERYTLMPFDRYRCIFVHIPKTAGTSVSTTLFGNLSGGHIGISSYEMIFSKREFNSYFKFAFVRNPWDRVFSAYASYKTYKGGGGVEDREWYRKNLSRVASFSEFVTHHLRMSEIQKHVHFIPQYRFICRPGSDKPLIDYIGRYENIVKDFDEVVGRLLMEGKVNLKHLNRSERGNQSYRHAYTEKTKDIVASVYAKDIELFQYQF